PVRIVLLSLLTARLCAEADMQEQLEQLKNWWQNTTPETQAALQDGGVVVVALLGGYVLGAIVARRLRARNFDAALRLPGSSPIADADSHITPTYIAGWLVRLTVWGAAAWWLAHKHGREELAGTVAL